MKERLREIWSNMSYYTLSPLLGKAKGDEDIHIYESQMLEEFNRLHRFIFPRFFSKIKSNETAIEEISEKVKDKIPIYITTNIGQLEYNYLNFLFLKRGLPLAHYANDLSTWKWMPLHLMRHTTRARLKIKKDCGGHLPHPVESGHINHVVASGQSILIRLKTSRIHDDLYWDTPGQDMITSLTTLQKEMDQELILVPLYFVWAKRPEGHKRSIIDLVFGERENPGRIRKLILFWRNYKKNASVHFSEPVSLKDFIEQNQYADKDEISIKLKSQLLSKIQKVKKRITGPPLKPRKWIIDQIVETESVQKIIYDISTKKKNTIEDVKTLARKYADEIAADISYSYIEFGNRILNWAFNNMYDGVDFNRDALEEIKRMSEHNPVIFVPNHKSHVDYLLLSNLLYKNDVAVPHVAAGINLSFWPVGKLFRRCGAFFIRRTFSGNILYKAVFNAYLRVLIEGGYCIEFFIEGGRSRTGKLRQPKLGIISALTKLMLTGASDELIFIPTSITYDKVIETEVYADETKGSGKKREKFSDIFRLKKYTKKRYGKIYLHFGQPLSFTKILQGTPKMESSKETLRELVTGLSTEIMRTLNRSIVVVPQSLVATGLLMTSKRGITSREFYRNIDLIKAYLGFREVKFANTLLEEFNRSVKEVMSQLDQQKSIEIHKDFDPVYYAIPESSRIQLNYQKNSILHYLLPISFLSSAIINLTKENLSQCPIHRIIDKVNYLKGLLRNEFVASNLIISDKKIVEAISFLSNRDVLSYNDESISINPLGINSLRLFKSLIDNYLDSFRIALHTSKEFIQRESFDEKALIKRMLKNGSHLLNLGQISYPESINSRNFENCIKYFVEAGLLIDDIPDKKSKEKKRYRWSASNVNLRTLQEELELFS